MWYVYLNREQHYLRSYRTHNLWFDQYQKKLRVPRATPFHIGLFKRLGKTYSGVSTPLESHNPPLTSVNRLVSLPCSGAAL